MTYVNRKWIQIIPAPEGLYNRYVEGGAKESKAKVVCIALVETTYDDGEVTRSVETLDVSFFNQSEGDYASVYDARNFIGASFFPMEE